MRSNRSIRWLAAISLAAATLTSPSAAPDSRLDWWREARFGMFIHWGLYAIPAGEWKGRTDYAEWIRNNAQIPVDEYDTFRTRFNPTKFDADAWVRVAKAAGMKYIVLTSKHHDGFGLFDSKETGFDVMSTPFNRDIVKELAAACARGGIRLGLYYSIMDWHHPDYLPRRPWEAAMRPAAGADFDRYVRYMKAQLRELLTNYGPIGILWFDGQWEGTWTNERGRDLYDYVRSLQPDIIVNNRVGRAGGDFGLNRDQGSIGDYGTPEQEIPGTGLPGIDWESCITMNLNWGYNRADKDFKSTKELVRMLVDVTSKGGNLLLNVGPTADGEFPPESVERLEAIGAWMRLNDASIHGTAASPFPRLPWGRATQRAVTSGTRLYLHVFDWPADGELIVPGLLNDARGAFLLADHSRRSLPVTRRGDDLIVKVPQADHDAIDTVVVLDVAGKADVAIAPAITADAPIFVDTLDVRITSDRDRVEARYTVDGSEPTAGSPVTSGHVRLSSTATVRARLFRGDRPVSPIAAATFNKVTPRAAERSASAAPGLRFEFVEGDFRKLPDFGTLGATRSGIGADFDLTPRTRDEQFAARFRGYIRIPADGVYRFFVRSDDGSRLWIGDDLVVDNDGLHSAHEESGVVALAAGLHPITVAMFEQSGGFELAVSWAGPGFSKQRIPPAALVH
jgi:alpha-L-fucosidase